MPQWKSIPTMCHHWGPYHIGRITVCHVENALILQFIPFFVYCMTCLLFLDCLKFIPGIDNSFFLSSTISAIIHLIKLVFHISLYHMYQMRHFWNAHPLFSIVNKWNWILFQKIIQSKEKWNPGKSLYIPPALVPKIESRRTRNSIWHSGCNSFHRTGPKN